MRIAFVGQEEYFKIHYENDLDYKHEIFRMDFNYHMEPGDFDALRAFNPEFTFFFRGEFMPGGVVRTIPGIKVAISSEPFPKVFDRQLHTNESFVERMETFLAIADKKFDYIFHYDDLSLPVLERVGARISGAWPFPIATRKVANFDSSTALIPSVNGNLDFFFAGRSTKHREKFFGHLKHLYDFLHIESGVPGLNAIPLAQASKIVLNVHADEGISWEPRVQFFMAAGCFVMSETISPNKYLIPGKHFIQFSGPDELHSLARRYLEDEGARLEIAQAGMDRVQDMLSATDQYDILIKDIMQNKYPRPSFKPSKEALAALRFHAQHPETDFVRNRFMQFSELID